MPYDAKTTPQKGRTLRTATEADWVVPDRARQTRWGIRWRIYGLLFVCSRLCVAVCGSTYFNYRSTPPLPR